jgi:hypothetical protein
MRWRVSTHGDVELGSKQHRAVVVTGSLGHQGANAPGDRTFDRDVPVRFDLDWPGEVEHIRRQQERELRDAPGCCPYRVTEWAYICISCGKTTARQSGPARFEVAA